jgi:hypothetical protein
MTMAETEWFEDYHELASFADALDEANEWDDVEELLYYIEKPFKWNTEHEKWEEFGNPYSEDEGWTDFKAALDAR